MAEDKTLPLPEGVAEFPVYVMSAVRLVGESEGDWDEKNRTKHTDELLLK